MRVWNDTKGPPPRRLGVLGRPLGALVTLTTVAVLAAGCSSSGSGSGPYGSGGTAPASGGTTGEATVSATSTTLGMVLVDGSGRTLYLFQKDQPDQSACTGACVAAWPVDQASGPPKAGRGVTAALLGTITRGDDTTQVTYDHHPLYYYAGDRQPGQRNGQGLNAFGATWYVLAPTGTAITGTGGGGDGG